MQTIVKYPRTPHIKGSRLQKGDEDLSQIPFEAIKGKYLVLEEKVDGANCAISFNDDLELMLQSRGHYLTGGYRERHFNFLKQWAISHYDELFNILGTRFIMYGEWLYAKHSIYYDKLPHYFLEFDIYDKERNVFLDTNTRHKMLENSCVVSVPVLAKGVFNSIDEIIKYLGDSNYISDNHLDNLVNEAIKNCIDPNRQLRETDNSKLMEGIYIKVEENGLTVDRMKYVRYSFLQTVEESQTHWLDRPIIPNGLNKNIDDLF